ncbi:hypothetical protein [Gimesia aquarii]|uniref:Knr4/Smi1-like domain-containing protein n=1 Tax=Gimesia aquarii TaxID=2527964 RepID=A0A517WN75_9PLAN|nr:hypothetical protein [Gimesia aquarii]QDU06719.1 hypothetical protein V202x_00620 [Gimesia aquarii]
MPSFKNYYRTLYRNFGYPLTKNSAIPPNVIMSAEKQLGVSVPTALRDYYLVAGRESRFNKSHNRLLAPKDWNVDKKRLLFMEENQAVLWWGVSVRNPDTQDPRVSKGHTEEPISWYREHHKCSVFLAVILHYQAVCGGFRFRSSADIPDEINYQFEKQGWTYYGTVNSLMAFSRTNQVVCLMPSNGLPFMDNQWTVLIGAKTKRDLTAVEMELGLNFESY